MALMFSSVAARSTPLRKILLLLLLSHFCACITAMATETTNRNRPPGITRIISNCACGRLHLTFPATAVTIGTPAVDCHCPKCRKFHLTGMVSYLSVPKDQVSIVGPRKTPNYRDKCDEVGEVDRIQCSECSSKLATQPVNGDNILVNMGTLLDQSIPPHLADMWRIHRKQYQLTSSVTWPLAIATAEFDPEIPKEPSRITGGCACGACRYEINCELPTELQHCYCRLCRHFSGGPFMTWMPVWNNDMKWTTTITGGNFAGARRYGPPDLVRTTPHGQRHFCPECRGALTIVYDDQPDVTWPAVGGYDDTSLPSDRTEMEDSLYDVIHICCNYKQSWYAIPQDGLPQIPEAC
jgi:hypothetical protein